MKTLIIVPAYNEEESLAGVIGDLRRHVPSAEVLVVNDGSCDGTGRIARDQGVRCIVLPFNLGIGGAVQAGYLYAERNGYEVAVQFDGDGQHLAKEIHKLIDEVASGKADLVIGSRFLVPGSYTAPLFRRMGIKVFSVILSRILDTTVTDSTSGFRAANRKVIEFFAHTYPEDYPEVEALVLLHKRELRVREIPVMMQERTGGISSITPLRSLYYMTKVLLAIFIDLMKKVR
ncbi:MAG: glycosyl transferase family 2 [Nitrospirae bacterium GWD2_57_9]|nr:MAG: glycosyl transferase family 2 [Nitrospirae bacterium GWD2_57_9]OGW48015.1 MAG: glycosyl transferase family 2 [Nitrospirae bacterium GWC2_57_9]